MKRLTVLRTGMALLLLAVGLAAQPGDLVAADQEVALAVARQSWWVFPWTRWAVAALVDFFVVG